MFDNEIERIHSILAGILGEAKNGGYSNGWRSYNCPYCADIEGVTCDNKFNLETNVENGCCFHCWKCETHGKLSKLISDYGTVDELEEYRAELKAIRESSLYVLSRFDMNDDEVSEFENFIELPKGFRKIRKDDKYSYGAMKYLYGRRIDDLMIERFNIGYIGGISDDFSLRNRVILPSYDSNGDLNYWVGRDYTGNNKVKYKNPKIQKTSIVFNEKLVNWYEDVTVVEGPFDHIVVPNSVPLLGKNLKPEYALYNALVERARANVNILLDDDAVNNAYRMYKRLEGTSLKGRVRLITCPEGYDAALIYEKYGRKGMIRLLQRASRMNEYDMLKVR